jgi:hypothetical protein
MRRRPSRGQTIGGLMLALLLVTNAPLHVCMPLPSDAVLYDMQARTILDGGALYRDVFETNLPGIVWIHAAVRSLAGWSSEALRMIDLAVFGGVVWLLGAILRRTGLSPERRVAVACMLWWCYLSVSEWCHCQRDTWMLLPALAAFIARLRQRDRLCVASVPARVVFGAATVEGLLWASAFWIKPFVAIPALACFGFTAWRARHARRVALDGAGLLCGGIVAGAAGVLWLRSSGAWPFFLDTFLEWNPDYVAGGRARWTLDRIYGIGFRLFPWVLLHVAAVPVAISALLGRGRGYCDMSRSRIRDAIVPNHCHPDASLSSHGDGPQLVAVFYLAWLGQTLVLQQPFDYIQVPPILLAISVLALRIVGSLPRPAVRFAVAGFFAAAAMVSPALKLDRLTTWWDCVTHGGTAEVRDRLAYLRTPDFSELARVAQFLRSQQVRDHELTCFHVHLIHLYPQLGVRPSTRYVGLEALRRLFPRHVNEIDRAVSRSPQRFVVTDLIEAGLSAFEGQETGSRTTRETHAHARSASVPVSPLSQSQTIAASGHINPSRPPGLPPGFPDGLRDEFPWRLPVVFRSGRYVVHAAP